MANILASSREYDIPHEIVAHLYLNSELGLAILPDFAQNLLKTDVVPRDNTVRSAHDLWQFVAAAILIGSITASIIWAWWLFIPGITGAVVLHNSSNNGNAGNLVDLGMDDPVFFERVSEMGGWIYNAEEELLEPYKRQVHP